MKAPFQHILCVGALAASLSSCSTTRTDAEFERLKTESQELEEKVRQLEARAKAISLKLETENRTFYNDNLPKLDEGGWSKAGGQIEVHAKTFIHRDAEISALRVRKKDYIFGIIKSRQSEGILLAGRPFARLANSIFLGDTAAFVSVLDKSGTLFVSNDGAFKIEGRMRQTISTE